MYKKSKNLRVKEFFIENKSTFLLGFLSFILAIFLKKLFFISFFVILDLTNSWANSKYKLSLPMDFLLTGLVLFSMKYDFYNGMIFIPFVILNKLIMGKLEFTHFLKVPTLIFISLITPIFSKSNLSYSIFVLLLVRYMVEYLITFIVMGELDIRKIPRRMYNLLGMQAFFIVFGSIFLTII
ncbi:hypothetical protein HN415_07515 [Candidatus Woesearchaeota archaeon]|nr:hypothetical protein [Candidatus Woesearchaeota archaeon]